MTEGGDRGPKPPRFTIAAVSDPGRQRKNNEDNCAVLRVAADGVEPADGEVELAAGETLLLLVADGMGGAAGGEVASGMALDTIGAEIGTGYAGGELDERQIGELLCSALGAANEVIYEEAGERTDLHGMDTTLTGAWIWGDVAHIVQIGDSRAYLFRKGQLQQLTQDQTLVEHLVSTGKMTREEAETAEDRNVILQALGVRPDIDPVLSTVFLQEGDTLFLCSDGLNAVLDNDRIQGLLGDESEHVPDTVRRLIDEANAGGAPDNVTVAMLRVGGPAAEREAADEDDLTDTQEVPVLAGSDHSETRPYPVVDEPVEVGRPASEEPEEDEEPPEKDEEPPEEDEPEAVDEREEPGEPTADEDEDEDEAARPGEESAEEEPEEEEEPEPDEERAPRPADTVPEGLTRPDDVPTRRMPPVEEQPPDVEAGAAMPAADGDELDADGSREPTQRMPSGPGDDLEDVLQAPASVITVSTEVDPRAVRWFVVGFVVFASTASLLMLVLR